MDLPHTLSSVITINVLKTGFFGNEVEAQDLEHWSHQVDDFSLHMCLTVVHHQQSNLQLE